MKEVHKYSNCFICGEKNIHGLKAKFYYDGNEVFTEIVTSRDFEGYREIFHGGVVSSLLDEVMIKAILARDIYAVTAEMTVRFLKPVWVDKKVKFVGKVVKNRGRIFHTEGKALAENGDILAEASGKYVEAGNDLKDNLMKSID